MVVATTTKKYSKYNTSQSDEYEETVQAFKAFFKITPKTIDHLWQLGYRAVDDFASPDKTPKSIAEEMEAYLTRNKANAGYDYTKVFRRMQWTAKASLSDPSLLTRFPSHCDCKHWSLSALRAKGCDVDENGAVIEVTGKVVGGEKEQKTEKDEENGGEGKRKASKEVTTKKRKVAKKSA